MPRLPPHLTGVRHRLVQSRLCPKGPQGLAEAPHDSCCEAARLEGRLLLMLNPLTTLGAKGCHEVLRGAGPPSQRMSRGSSRNPLLPPRVTRWGR